MWAAKGEHIIWNMQQEMHDAKCAEILLLLGKYIDVESWVAEYESCYKKWLHADDTAIHDVNSMLNSLMLHANQEFNKQEPFTLYYWFDVDRTAQENFQWQFSPLSGETLRELPPLFHRNNRCIAPHDLLVFPAAGLL